jgi:hypothetical protein
MKAIAYVFAALVLVSAVTLVPVMAQTPGQEEVKTALASIVDASGIILPAEDALVNFIAVCIVYFWNFFGVFATFIKLMPILGLGCLYAADFQHSVWQYCIILNKAWIKAVSSGLCFCCGISAIIPACLNLILMALGASISYVLNWVGSCTVDLANACAPIQEYFPTA